MDQNENAGRRYRDTDEPSVRARRQTIDERAESDARARVDMTRAVNDARYQEMEGAREAMRKREEESLYANRTVEANYAREDSLEALAKREKKRQRQERKERMRALGEFYESQQASERNLAAFQSKLGSASTGATAVAKQARKGVSRWLITISAYICFWQGIFAILSLFGFAAHAYFLHLTKDTWLGKIFGFFVDYEDWFPGQYLGMGFWAVACMIGVGGFICFMLFFYLTRIKMVRSLAGLLVMAMCFALTLLPVSNVFPWLLIWVLYIHTNNFLNNS